MTTPTAEEQPQRWSSGGLSREIFIYNEPHPDLPPSSYKSSWGHIVQAVVTPSGPLELILEGEDITGRQKVIVPPNNRDAVLRGFNTSDIKTLEGKDISTYTIDGKLHGVGVRVPELMFGSMN
ncbi:MAG TPA: hypothetical protein VJI97_03925 [Candidatus Nanoarchaeia archaeon]|nr:hypothetical protein [Candidatus Nanoarchaeia archaeon]